ncbi:MAG: 50S ribosome-binding GTPase [Nanoarchaeota archaeon]|nr:50S ribosome-binding GTPase [Nanoarchaeota archaeon]
MGFWPVVMNVLRNSDVVLLLVDARMPEITKNSEIVSKVENMKGKRLVIVFNKSDLIGRKDIEKLKKEYPNAFFISATKKIGIGKLKSTLENMAEHWNRPSLRVGLVGYPNIGKSTLINLLAPAAHAKVSPVSGTTRKTLWVRNGRLRIMDSPGIIPYGDKKVQVGMTASKDPHKIKNPEKVAISIIELLMGKDPKLLEKYYKASGATAYEIFEDIGHKMGYLVKGGEVDENRIAIKVIDDWQRGRIMLK